jgi:hypothetical protein
VTLVALGTTELGGPACAPGGAPAAAAVPSCEPGAGLTLSGAADGLVSGEDGDGDAPVAASPFGFVSPAVVSTAFTCSS